jgi:LysR family glycine cleavage system transcriptional activator
MYGRAMPSAGTPPRSPSPRRRRPIGLASLRGFEAAARLLSFTRAADELALTQSAISRQIGTLERQVGKPLFTRATRSLALTSAGARLHAVVARVLADLDRCVDDLRGVDRPPRVSLTTYASFASLWLVPRLASFQHENPRIEIRIDASDRSIDLESEGVDVAIRCSPPRRVAGLAGVTDLGAEVVTPMLSPVLLAQAGGEIATPADLAQLPLIEIEDPRTIERASDWPRWFESVGAARARATAPRLTFGFIDQAMQAAIRGQGVVLGRSPLVEDAVASGQLVEPFPDLRLATGYRYYLVVNPERAAAPEVAAFVRWLVQRFEHEPVRPA